jgi:ribosomal-protein-alanine N-acetyltransferase
MTVNLDYFDERSIVEKEKNRTDKTPAQNFGDMLEAFGNAISQIFDDPELKQKGKEFGQSTRKAAETFGKRFKDEEVKARFNDVGNAAEEFGRSVAALFRENRESGHEKEKPTE